MDQQNEVLNIVLAEFPDIDPELLQALFSAYKDILVPLLENATEKIGAGAVALSLVLVAGQLIKEELSEKQTDFNEFIVSARDAGGKENGTRSSGFFGLREWKMKWDPLFDGWWGRLYEALRLTMVIILECVHVLIGVVTERH
jgi:hypothetical protein